jgi:uncharacterized membrane protein YheB (UPF0754 family)
MNYWLILIPLLTAFTGWFTIRLLLFVLFHPVAKKRIAGFSIQGILPAKQPQIAARLGQVFTSALKSSSVLEEKINDPENIRKILPLIENHIDDFLRHRLSTEMPMISMFIGDKTIGKLKTAFLNEIETLFPVVMKQYAGNLLDGPESEQMITQKIAGFSPSAMETFIRKNLSGEIRKAGLAAAFFGLLIGLLQCLILYLAF